MQARYSIPVAVLVVVLAFIFCASYAKADVVDSSYYGLNDGLAGHLTASGEPMNPSDYTAAHPFYAFGTKLKVCLVSDPDRCVRVRVTDRGPAPGTGKGLDLSHAAGMDLGLLLPGHALVTVEVVD